MPGTTVVGYVCSLCGNRVVVLRSTEVPQKLARDLVCECKCGDVRRIHMHEIQSLDVWKETASA